MQSTSLWPEFEVAETLPDIGCSEPERRPWSSSQVADAAVGGNCWRNGMAEAPA